MTIALRGPGSSPRWTRAALILAACALAYAPTLAASFVYDDRWTIVTNPFIADPGNLFRLLVGDVPANLPDGPRPFMVATTFLDRALFGLAPTGWHLQSLLWHGACSWLLSLLTFQLSRDGRLALAAGLLFAVHPIHTEAVASISYREDLIAAFALLAGMTAAIRAARGGGRAAVALGCLALFAGTNAKETVVMFPVLLGVYEFCAFDLDEARPRRWLWPYAPLVIASLCSRFWIGIATGSLALEHARFDWDLAPLDLLFTQAGIWLAYIGQQVVPVALSADYATQVTRSPDARVLGALLGVLLLLVAAGASRRRHPLLAFGLLWFFVNLLPTANFVPMENLRADRYLYVPSAGYCLILGLGIRALARRIGAAAGARREARTFAALLAALGVAYGIATFVRVQVWQDELTLWHATAAATPDSVRARIALMSEYRRRGELHEALAQGLRAQGLAPRNWSIHTGLGALYSEQGRHRKAFEHLEEALAVRGPGDPTLDDELALAHYRAGDRERGIELLAEATLRSPDHGRLFFHLGQLLYAAGRHAEAEPALREATRLLPQDAVAHRFLAQSLLRLSRLAEARAVIQRAIELAPSDRRNHTVLTAIGQAERRPPPM